MESDNDQVIARQIVSNQSLDLIQYLFGVCDKKIITNTDVAKVQRLFDVLNETC